MKKKSKDTPAPQPPPPGSPNGQHPVELGHYTITTPMLSALTPIVVRWVARNATGNILRGNQRHGKSHACPYFSGKLSEKFPGILTYTIICRTALKPTERAFFERLLEATHHLDPSRGTASAMRNRLTGFLVEEVRRSNQNRIVLFIDEAQKLLETHYDWLIDLHNELRLVHVDMTVILVGQNELIDQRSDYKARRKNHIFGRFMREEYELAPIRTKAELAECLKKFDDPKACCWPEGSGICYTAHFFKEAYAAGWRLANIADVLWESFDEVRVRNGVSQARLEIALEDFFLTIKTFLIEVGRRKSTDPDVKKEELMPMIVEAGFGSAELPPEDPGEDSDDDPDES
ncbi:hypothetical protein DB347_20410 [Opitutaceae bacterium EW11]|nr:hypothetical protein DB347_20410 [Opitutaceae bacterium EW11]